MVGFEEERWLSALTGLELNLGAAEIQPVEVVVISWPRPDETLNGQVRQGCADVVEHAIH